MDDRAWIKEAGGELRQKWALAHQPTEKTGTSFVGGTNMTVFKQSKNRDAGWKFIDFRRGPRPRRRGTRRPAICRPTSRPGTLPRSARTPTAVGLRRPARGRQVAAGVAKWEEVGSAINGELEKVTQGETSPEHGCAAMQEEAEPIGTGGMTASAGLGAGGRAAPGLAAGAHRVEFAVPFVLLFAVFMAGPILVSFVTSFTTCAITDIRRPFEVSSSASTTTSTCSATRRSAKRPATPRSRVFAVPLTIGIGLLVGLGLNQGDRCSSRGVFRVGLLPAGGHEHHRHRRGVALILAPTPGSSTACSSRSGSTAGLAHDALRRCGRSS